MQESAFGRALRGLGTARVNIVVPIKTQGFYPTKSQASRTFQLMCTLMPPELTGIVLDMAQYWPMERYWNDHQIQVRGNSYHDENQGLTEVVHVSTRGHPLPKRIRKIRIVAISHDQGWAGDQTSWTWGKVCLKLKDEQKSSIIEEFYRNQVAHNQRQTHEKVYLESSNESMMHDLDQIDVIHCAQFPGWTNHVYYSLIEIFYAHDFDL